MGQDLNLKSYSSYGYGSIVTCVPVDWKIPNTNLTCYGTSGASPMVVGLLAQWYIWFYDLFGVYPSTEATYDFIRENSADIWSESDFIKIGYGLFRLPHKFKATDVKICTNDNSRYTILKKYVENEEVIEKTIDLLEVPFIKNGRTFVPSNGLTSQFGVSVYWKQEEFSSHYVK